MMRHNGKTHCESVFFSEWASCFSEGLFVIMQVFSDESDTYAEGPTPSLYGWVQEKERWTVFAKRWGRVLSNYGAPYFHFREFADKKNKSVIEKSPYRDWSDAKRDSFLYELALLCAESAVPVCGSCNAKMAREEGMTENPYEIVMRLFFQTLTNRLNEFWPDYRGQVMLIFDKNDNDEWLVPLNKVHKEYAANDRRLNGSLVFSDDKEVLPIQAADLQAYAMRQHAGEAQVIFSASNGLGLVRH